MAPLTESTTVVQLTATTHFPIKLTPTNFSVWSKQIQSTLIGLDLAGYIDGSFPPPARFLDDAHTKSNPLYTIWFRQDQVLISALLGSCTESIQPLITTAASSRDAWTRLTNTYASTTPGRVLFLKAKLAQNPKGNRTIVEYLKDMSDIADSLALAGHPVADDDLVASIITQLGDEYRSVYSALRVRETSVSLAALSDILQDIERLVAPSSDQSSLVPTANATRSGNSSGQATNQQASSNSRQGGRGYRGRGGRGGSGGRSNYNQGYPDSVECGYCHNPGHTAKVCRKLARFLREQNIMVPGPPSPNVNSTMAGPSSPSPTWLFDTGASHHAAAAPPPFPTFSEYGGPDEIHLGNGPTHGDHSSTGAERK